MMRRVLLSAFVTLALGMSAQTSQRETIRLNEGWRFALGHAADPAKDFGCGTEYFNYLTKANSIHNEGPYVMKFNASDWQEVSVPHDWVTTLPYASEPVTPTAIRPSVINTQRRVSAGIARSYRFPPRTSASTSPCSLTVSSATHGCGSTASIWARNPVAMPHRSTT